MCYGHDDAWRACVMSSVKDVMMTHMLNMMMICVIRSDNDHMYPLCRWRRPWRRVRVCDVTRSWPAAMCWWTVRLRTSVLVNVWDTRSPSVAAFLPRTLPSCTGGLLRRKDTVSPSPNAWYVLCHRPLPPPTDARMDVQLYAVVMALKLAVKISKFQLWHFQNMLLVVALIVSDRFQWYLSDTWLCLWIILLLTNLVLHLFIRVPFIQTCTCVWQLCLAHKGPLTSIWMSYLYVDIQDEEKSGWVSFPIEVPDTKMNQWVYVYLFVCVSQSVLLSVPASLCHLSVWIWCRHGASRFSALHAYWVLAHCRPAICT